MRKLEPTGNIEYNWVCVTAGETAPFIIMTTWTEDCKNYLLEDQNQGDIIVTCTRPEDIQN